MKALESSLHFNYPNELVLSYIDLYKSIGNGHKNIETLNKEYSIYHDITFKDDIKYLFEMFFKGYKITEARVKSIIKGNDTVAKNNDEKYLINLTEIFNKIYSDLNFNLSVNEIKDLEGLLERGIKDKPTGFKKAPNNQVSYRDKLDSLINKYDEIKKTNSVEILYLNTSFMVDFIKLSPFYNHNELIGLLIFYILNLRGDCQCAVYSSFFKKIESKVDEFTELLNKSYYLYDEGLINLTQLIKFFLNIYISLYDEIEDLVRFKGVGNQLSKTATVETVIYGLPYTFSKSDIMEKLPNISKTTIDRVLASLQKENKIMPLNKGRGSQWVRLDNSYEEREDFLKQFK